MSSMVNNLVPLIGKFEQSLAAYFGGVSRKYWHFLS